VETRRGAARCLIVDADHEVRALIADVLRADGHHDVECVYTGADALRVLEERPSFDLVLGELTTPARDDALLHQEISTRWPHLVPRLICITHGSSAGVSELRAASVPILVKPFAPMVLQAVVTQRLAAP
jgi:DNA-binding NtrC family response regulator